MCEAEFLVAAPRLCRVWCDFGNQFYLRIANQILGYGFSTANEGCVWHKWDVKS